MTTGLLDWDDRGHVFRYVCLVNMSSRDDAYGAEIVEGEDKLKLWMGFQCYNPAN